MLDSPEEARAYPRGDIELVFCEACGFVFNRALDPLLTEYSDRYEPTQAYSPTFQRFHRDLAGRLAGGARPARARRWSRSAAARASSSTC